MINNLSMSGIASNNSDVLTADFTGNGSMDFLLYNKGYKDKFYAFYDMEPNSPYYQMGYEVSTGSFIDIYPVTSLTWNNKISAGQGMALVKDNGVGSYKFDVYSSGTVAPVYFQYNRVWDNVPLGPEFYSNCDNTSKQNPLNYQFLSGDFNGDGLTDIIAINDAIVVTYENPQAIDDPQYNPGNCDQGTSDVGSTVHFINLDRRITSGFVTNVGMLSVSYQYGEKLLTGDYNGDGRTDILHIKYGVMYVYTINNNNQLVLLWQKNDNRINNTELALLGDYNGDGKTDIMFSTGNNSTFATFTSTGKSFEKAEQSQPFSNKAGTWNGTLSLYYLIPNDVDGDGKTDIISASTATTDNSANGSTNISVYYSGSPASSGQPNFFYGGSTNISGPLKHYPIPLFLNPTKPNTKLELGFISNNSISLFRFNRDFRSESQLTNINQDGVVHTVEYRSIDSDQIYNNDVQLYSVSYDQTYPYVDLHTIPGLNVVSKINRYYGAEQISQVFGYGKAVSHAGGLGFLGFGELIRSNWHVDNSDVNRIFNISIFDPQLRGAQIKSFTSKSTYINPAFKDKIILPSDTTLLNSITSAQTVEASNSITLLPGFIANGNNGIFLAKIRDASAEINDGATINDYITRTENTYSPKLLSNKVWINLPTVTANKDMLSGTFNTQTVTYDAYYNPSITIANINGQGSKMVEVTYENNPAGNYIGRPLSSKTTLNNGSDTYTSEEEFTYSGFLPSQARKKGNGTDWVTENMTYDVFGNITQKMTTVPGGAQRTVSMTYDPTGRFVTSATDAEGMVSTAVYDQATGNKQNSTNPFNQTESYVYDTWGRLITTTDYLGVNGNRSYQQDGYNIVVTQSDDEGHSSIAITNPLGQTIETKSKNILGQYIGQATQFDVYGREIASSEATQAGNYTQWNTTAYDEYGRIKQATSFTGKVTSISYNGLSSTVNDGNKSVTTVKNAFGQVASLQDPGGNISYSYSANGNMKTADYGGIIQTIEQDGWGRKTKLTDPSAGIYQYEYDGWGQLIKETNPKGYTQYTYDASGKVSQKKIIGDETNMQYGYTYDNATKLLTSMALTNADGNNANYTYNYDANKRIQSTVEDNLHARFVKSYAYDSYGRVSGENYEAKDKQSNITVSKGIDLQYQNGELLQTSLQGTGQIIWKVNNLNNKGQISDASQGSALKNTFQYDAYGLPQQATLQNVSASPVTLMNLSYSFDAQRGVLNSRSNSAFDWNENFGYDNLDRLTSFNDNISNNSQSYDNRGRIQNNSQLGDYAYDGASYKQTELDLSNNETAKAYYQQDHALQQVNYNVFKSPVEIIEQGKERISFQYNGSLGRSHMYFGDEEADKLNRRFRRHYSEDGGMEITNDLQTGKNSFVFYLSGDAYSAPAIWKEVHQAGQSSQTTQNLYYLHRDHLSSIVMITNDQGGVVEKRQFDAWGNIVKIQDGNGNDLSAFVILDRGYTGHEHLLGVGLIHMNGRLYDPKLHRFLSPDNFVQDPYNTQNYNRYGYAMNNPLMYIDPNGEFLWAFVGIGALIGALTGGVSYAASAIRTGDWSWKGLGMSMLTGAVIGGITGGVNPAAAISNSLGATFATAFVGGLMPSINLSIDNFSFSISPSIVFGKSFGIGANLSVGYSDGNWSIGAGLGFMAYGNYQGFGKSGNEIRGSLMAAYDNGTNGFSLGTNQWWGSDGMSEFKQRTGAVGLHFGDFRALYENDGGSGIKNLELGNRGDSYRTAALNLSYRDLSVGFNLFTGFRNIEEEERLGMSQNGKFSPVEGVTSYGRSYPRGFVNEINNPYRLGALTVGYKNYRLGVNSEHIRHAIQDKAIHGLISDGGFKNQSWNWQGYSQYRTRNNYSSW